MKEIKNLNPLEKSIYKLILQSPKLKKDLIDDLNIPKTTVNRTLQSLIEKNLIKEIGIDLSTGGRPPIIYGPVSNNYFIIALDISRSYSEVIIIDSSLNLIFKDRFKMNSNSTPVNTVNKAKKIIDSTITKLNLEKSKILGISIAVVEPLNLETGILGPITNSLNNNWTKLNIKELMSNLFDFPILIDKGTNMAAFGEFFINSNNLNKIIYLNLGRGIRYGLVNKGEIINPSNNFYDPLGHMTINSQGLPCSCGKNGCLELYGTIVSIEENFNKTTNSNLNIDEILLEMKRNNSFAKLSVDNALFNLAIGINNLFNILNPDKVIINGPLIQLDPYIFQRLKKNLKDLNNNFNNIDSIYFNKSIFKENIISMGAALTFLINYMDN